MEGYTKCAVTDSAARRRCPVPSMSVALARRNGDVAAWITTSTPATASSRPSPVDTSPGTTSTDGEGVTRVLCTKTRTSWPRAVSRGMSADPRMPAGPVTKTRATAITPRGINSSVLYRSAPPTGSTSTHVQPRRPNWSTGTCGSCADLAQTCLRRSLADRLPAPLVHQDGGAEGVQRVLEECEVVCAPEQRTALHHHSLDRRTN